VELVDPGEPLAEGEGDGEAEPEGEPLARLTTARMTASPRQTLCSTAVRWSKRSLRRWPTGWRWWTQTQRGPQSRSATRWQSRARHGRGAVAVIDPAAVADCDAEGWGDAEPEGLPVAVGARSPRPEQSPWR
jgi:hypothetical protein